VTASSRAAGPGLTPAQVGASAYAGPVLAARGVQVTFASASSQLEALAEASLEIMPNEFVGLIGPSGCGKSTLLRVLGGLIKPTAGEVLFEGQPLGAPQRKIGFVFQKPSLMPWRSALRNVTLPLEIAGVPLGEARARAREMLTLVGLAEFYDARPHELSGGMQQRVALARELVYDPDVLLLDEPFGALDALTREKMNAELLRIWQARLKTCVMVTHDIQEAVFLCDRIIPMTPRPGRLKEQIVVDLPRPRSLDLLSSPRFSALTAALRRSLG
jgi:NitT/TauT family transport system ATP-binding protein